MPGPYIELHAHTSFSFLDGASSPEEMAGTAAELGLEALAITDHDGLCGSLAFAHAAKAVDLRPITGAELTLTDGSHLTLLVKNERGYSNLCRLITLAHANTRPPPDRRPIPPELDPSHFEAHAEGLICLTGCAREGVVPRLINAGKRTEALNAARRLVDIFGRHNVYVEIQRPRLHGERTTIRALRDLADALHLPVVATGNVHMHHPRRGPLQDTFVSLHHRLPLDRSERERRGNHQAVLRAPAESARLFEEVAPGAAAMSLRVAERCEFDLTRDLGYRFPDFAAERGETADAMLHRICMHQLGARYPNAKKREKARERLITELDLVEYHDLAGFFLMHRELLELAREVALDVRPAGSARRWLPPGRGRGSSVGSIVCYLTGLSHIDPIESNLFLGRFLNRDMVSVPDIDLDFPRDVRERLIEEVIARYGPDHAALVAAFPTFRMRMAIRELGKALALPEAELERLARLSDGWSAPDALEEEMLRLPDGKKKLESPRWRALVELAKEAAGLPRHLSQHSGGMIVSARPLVELVPVVPAAFPGRQMCQWDKDSCADAGFVKIDLLGLGMLSAVEECVESIAHGRGERIDLSRIDFNDRKVYDEIHNADTVGAFQIESRAQMQSLLQTRPENLHDLTIQVALIRPGPVSGGAVHPYVKHRRARRDDPDFEPPYDHPLLEECLRETLGVVVFQEQVLEVAMALSGFTAGQAEGLRRAMSRKRSREAMLALWKEFLEGAREQGVEDETTKNIFTKLVGFSNFGFPKAHAAAFAVLAYQSCWLRRHYPVEFLTALLNAQPMGFYPPATLVRDAQRRGVRTVSACVNRSFAKCVVEDNAMRVGLGYIRGIREDAAQRMVDERDYGGPFRNLVDLATRTDLRTEQLTHVVRAGACDVFGRPRREMMWEIGTLARPRNEKRGTQLALPIEPSPAPELPDLSRFERVVTDYETMGLSAGWHLIALLRPSLPKEVISARQLRETPDGAQVAVAGLLVARQRPGTAHGIVFILLEDETGLMNGIVMPQVYEQYRQAIRSEPLVIVRGTVERRERNLNVKVANITKIDIPDEVLEDADVTREELPRLRAAVPPGQHFGRGRR